MIHFARSIAALLAAAILGGCAIGKDPRDPFESVNRGIYKFNDRVDKAVLRPTARVYQRVVPSFVRQSVSNAFSNVNDVRVGLNNALQGKFAVAYSDFGRVMMNSTLGVLGLFDIASEAGIEKHQEDFGQTLGWWGVGNGPFLVLPILGPSNLRDTAGLITDNVAAGALPVASTINDEVFFGPAVYALYVIDRRKIQPFRYHESGNVFEHDLVRYLYTRKRELDIRR